jgi:hypothetical protein
VAQGANVMASADADGEATVEEGTAAAGEKRGEQQADESAGVRAEAVAEKVKSGEERAAENEESAEEKGGESLVRFDDPLTCLQVAALRHDDGMIRLRWKHGANASLRSARPCGGQRWWHLKA